MTGFPHSNMPHCVLRYCKHKSSNVTKGQGITFHRFPRPDQDSRHKWIQFVQNVRRDEAWLPSEHSFICSAHFRDEDKYLTKCGRTYLKKTAVPYDDFKPLGIQNPRSIGTRSDPLMKPLMQPLLKPLSTLVSDTESILDSPAEISLKYRLQKVITAKKKLAEKIKNVQRQNRNLNKKCESLLGLVKSLRNKCLLEGTADSNLILKTEVVKLYKKCMKNNKQSRKSLKYIPTLRKLALTLHYYYSPVAHKHLRPSDYIRNPRNLCGFKETDNAETGFTKEAFQALKRKTDSNGQSVVCALIVDEMAIRKQSLFHYHQKLGAPNFRLGQKGGEDNQVASQALVFMIVSLTENWKLPVGYFLVSGITAATKANLINTCLQKCHDVGVTVVSLTIDGSSVNFSAVEILGCELTDLKNIKTNFPHPSTLEKICIIIDPSHVINLIHNTFKKHRLLFDEDGKAISWELLTNVDTLQKTESLKFEDQRTPRHIDFRNQLIKVKLATQFWSLNVANALILYDEVFKPTQFLNPAATVNFITLMNILFDTMSSSKCRIDEHNQSTIFSFLNRVKDYVLNLKFHVNNKRVIKRENMKPLINISSMKKIITESSNKTGFIGVIINIESLKTLYRHVVEEKKIIKFISTFQLGRYNLQLFFKNINNTNYPDVLQFQTAYKNSLYHLELRGSFNNNCIPLDNFTISKCSSIKIINTTTPLKSLNIPDDEKDVLPFTRKLNSDVEAKNTCNIFADTLNNEQDRSNSQLFVGYISGYVARLLTKLISCEECVNSLNTTEKLPHHKLITIKDMGGLCYSADDVYKICLITESVIRNHKKQMDQNCLSTNHDLKYITVKTFECFIEKEVFTCLTEHSFNQPCTFNHRIHLIRAIITKYTAIRLKMQKKTTYSNRYVSKFV